MRPSVISVLSLLLVICCAAASPAKADTYVMADGAEIFRPEGPDTALSLLVMQPVIPKVGFMGYAFVSRKYAEAYAGPAFLLGPLSLGGGIGIEQFSPGIRTGLVTSLELQPITLFSFAEIGGSGPWASLEAVFHANELLGVGALGMSDAGIGPRLEITPISAALMLNGSVMYGWWDDSATGLIGLRGTIF